MKCFGLWINDDGTAQVAELTPEIGEEVAAQIEAQPAESAQEAMAMLEQMAAPTEEQSEEEQTLAGYNKGAKPAGGMPLKKVFGDE